MLPALLDIFEQGDGQRVDFFTRGAARYPDADRIGVLVANDLRENIGLQSLKCIRIPEKLGYVDQNVFIKGMHLGGVGFEPVEVLHERIQFV